MKTARFLGGLLVASWILASVPALAQRPQLATPVETAPASTAPGVVATAPSAPSTYAAPATTTPYPSQPLNPPALAPSTTFASPSGVAGAPSAAAPGTIITPPAAMGAGTVVSPNGVTQPPATNWDPYATPCNTPGALLQQDPYLATTPAISMAGMQKFVQHINFDYDWFAGHGNQELGINDVDLSVTFAFPLFQNIQTPLLVTPGFAVHYWEGPVSVLPAPGGPPPADLPPQTYDAYLDFAWNPQISTFFGAELDFRTGVYSDFSRVTSNSIRFMGKGLAVVKLSPHISVKAGVWYLDRVKTKILPAGGIVWTPNDDIYFNILFPNPKVAKRLTTWGTTEWWLYGSGDYGGGTWNIKRNTGFEPPWPTDGTSTRFDYNDIRVACGLEFKTLRQWEGHFEVGFACSRELIYQDNSPRAYYPRNTVYLGAGLTY